MSLLISVWSKHGRSYVANPWLFQRRHPHWPLGHTAILKPSKTNHTMPWNWEQAEIQHQHLKLYRIRGRTQNLLTLVTLAYSASTLSFTLLTNHSLLCVPLSLSSLPRSVWPTNRCGIFMKLISYDIYFTTSLFWASRPIKIQMRSRTIQLSRNKRERMSCNNTHSWF